jgi:hypothetical protein
LSAGGIGPAQDIVLNISEHNINTAAVFKMFFIFPSCYNIGLLAYISRIHNMIEDNSLQS